MRNFLRDKKEFNKSYISVIISSIILVLLIIGLVVVVLVNPTNDEENPTGKVEDKGKYSVNKDDLIVDTSSTKCSAKDAKKISSDAEAVSVSFDVTQVEDPEEMTLIGYEEEVDDPIMLDAYNLQFTNITKNIYLKITNDLNDETKILKYEDVKDGVASYESIYVTKKVKYTVTVFAANEACTGEVYRKFTFTTPIFNIYSKNCSDKKSNLCSVVVDEEVSAQKIINTFGEDNTKKEKDNKKETTTNYLIYIIGGAVILACAGGGAYFLTRKKKVK